MKLNEIKLNTQIFDRAREIPVIQKNKEMVQEIIVDGINTTVFDAVTIVINSMQIVKRNGNFETRIKHEHKETTLERYSTFNKAVKDIIRLRDTVERALLLEIAKAIPTRFRDTFNGEQNNLREYANDAVNLTLQDQTRFFDGVTFDVLMLEAEEKECYALELVETFNKPLNKLFAIGVGVNDNGDQRLWGWDINQWNKFYSNSTYIG